MSRNLLQRFQLASILTLTGGGVLSAQAPGDVLWSVPLELRAVMNAPAVGPTGRSTCTPTT